MLLETLAWFSPLYFHMACVGSINTILKLML